MGEVAQVSVFGSVVLALMFVAPAVLALLDKRR
jgi:hypothetical protein